MARVAAVVLAAGEASRFGAPKQRLLLPDVLERLSRSPVAEIVVVQGAHELPLSGSEPQGAPRLRLVSCPEWERGPGASLRCGLAALGDDVEAAVVVLADGPELSPAAVERVLDAWREAGGVVAASYEGNRGHPLVLGRAAWKDVPDEGLRFHLVELVPCDDLGSPGDVDTQEIQDIKRVIREAEAVSGIETLGLTRTAARFLNLPFYQIGKVRKDPVGAADVAIVRALLVPSLVSLFGSWNWYLPAGLARILRVQPSRAIRRQPVLEPAPVD